MVSGLPSCYARLAYNVLMRTLNPAHSLTPLTQVGLQITIFVLLRRCQRYALEILGFLKFRDKSIEHKVTEVLHLVEELLTLYRMEMRTE